MIRWLKFGLQGALWQCSGHGLYDHCCNCCKLLTWCWTYLVSACFRWNQQMRMSSPCFMVFLLGPEYFVGLPSDGGEQRRRKDGVFRCMPPVLVQGFGWPWRWRQTYCCRECRTWSSFLFEMFQNEVWRMAHGSKSTIWFKWSDRVTMFFFGIPWYSPILDQKQVDKLLYRLYLSLEGFWISYAARDDLSPEWRVLHFFIRSIW